MEFECVVAMNTPEEDGCQCSLVRQVFPEEEMGCALDFYSYELAPAYSIPLMTAMRAWIPGEVDQCWWIVQQYQAYVMEEF